VSSESHPVEQPNEVILFEGAMAKLEELHAHRKGDTFTHTFISADQTVTLKHSSDDPRRYSFSIPNREGPEDQELFSDKVFSVNIFEEGEVEVPHALLSVYKKINPARKLGDLALDWEVAHRITPAGVPREVERRRFEAIFADYVADREPQDG
jgi:hypothetical protein